MKSYGCQKRRVSLGKTQSPFIALLQIVNRPLTYAALRTLEVMQGKKHCSDLSQIRSNFKTPKDIINLN